ncbi:tyrosinase [Podospora aff. communis PSN243]|uniref:Tyrosinase n=1 Tax=Podospora aff. communis PSN243 TaxID=3040156 RepID=A0AAV9GSE5_9PEZI|nr:tyrosinase [Podospora aff. communis PSN243]
MWLSHLSALVALSSIPWVGAQRLVGIKAGVNPTTGERPARLNINDLMKNGPQWDLFIQALAAVYATDQKDSLSWYQIAGIHGIPFEPYGGDQQTPGNPNTGYCPHGQLTFITWHRPYLALLEQTIHTHATRIAAQYPPSSSAAYKSAAETLRFPYWDWADASTPMAPPVTTEPTITITTPSGRSTINNPLYTYEFPTFPFTHPDFLNRDFSDYPTTMRCINTTLGPPGTNNFSLSQSYLRDQYPSVRNAVYKAFSTATTFIDMASTSGSGGKSLENPHNMIHQSIGGGRIGGMSGHIKPTEWAAFDPIFWLHHANVDRQFAMWQAIYHEQAMFSGSVSGQPTFGSDGRNITPDSALRPFVDGEGKDWTNRRVQGTRELGYTYAGVEEWKGSKEEVSARVREMVNRLYGPATAAVKGRRGRVGRRQGVGKEYSVLVKVDREDEGLELPCSVRVFIGGKFAGELALLNMPKVGPAYANVAVQEALEEAGVPLDKAAAEVVEAVKGKLRVEVLTLTAVQSLAVEIQDRDFTPAMSVAEFPQYGEVTSWPVKIQDLKAM